MDIKGRESETVWESSRAFDFREGRSFSRSCLRGRERERERRLDFMSRVWIKFDRQCEKMSVNIV